MRRVGVRRVASLDDGFAVYRFGPRRDRAFESSVERRIARVIIGPVNGQVGSAGSAGTTTSPATDRHVLSLPLARVDDLRTIRDFVARSARELGADETS